jgi:hypothetical protein
MSDHRTSKTRWLACGVQKLGPLANSMFPGVQVKVVGSHGQAIN